MAGIVLALIFMPGRPGPAAQVPQVPLGGEHIAA